MVMLMVMMFWLCWVSLPKIDVSLIGLVYHYLLFFCFLISSSSLCSFSFFFFIFLFYFSWLLFLLYVLLLFLLLLLPPFSRPSFRTRCAILLGPGERRVRHTRALHQHQAVSPQCQCLPGACNEPHSQISWRTFQELWLRGWYLHFESCKVFRFVTFYCNYQCSFYLLTYRFFIRQPASLCKICWWLRCRFFGTSSWVKNVRLSTEVPSRSRAW